MSRRTRRSGSGISLRQMLCDLLEAYGRHTGHVELLGAAVGGRAGEDAPVDLRPAILPA